MKEGYEYLEPITTVAIIVSIITVGLGTAKIVSANRNARKIRQEIIREGYRTQYLKQDELNQIQNSTSYQRKMVRDYLGYIAKDEHLVIFPESTIL